MQLRHPEKVEEAKQRIQGIQRAYDSLMVTDEDTRVEALGHRWCSASIHGDAPVMCRCRHCSTHRRGSALSNGWRPTVQLDVQR